MALSFRPATADDWPCAWEIQREAFREAVTRTAGGWNEAETQKCADAWLPARTRMVLAQDDVVGWIRVEHRADHDWLDLLVVSPRHQGRGVGTAVLELLLAEARARGVPLRLSVHRTNPARRLYARLGFTEEPRDAQRMWMSCGQAEPAHPLDRI